MATISILTNLKLNKEETKRYNEIMESESPCKDIQPISYEEVQKREVEVLEWLTKSTH